MDLKPLEEKIAFLQRHVEQQDRAMLELTREVTRISERLARAEARLKQQAGGEDSGPPADERPPHW
ncbi:MAG: SlyX family protein [Verrucomicrobia bacterium]|nr:SlyX family protein [Verrucomicrobiota bacterium]